MHFNKSFKQRSENANITPLQRNLGTGDNATGRASADKLRIMGVVMAVAGKCDSNDGEEGSELAPHLRLHFEKDKPSTGTIHSRTPLLVGLPVGQ